MQSQVEGKKKFSIKEIIRNEQVEIYFQPIISTYQDKMAGVEALVRGIDNQGNIISPLVLFEEARRESCVIELDRLCQQKAIETFSRNFGVESGIILFVNVDYSVIHQQSDIIYEYVKKCGLSTERIVLELNELESQDASSLETVKNFVRYYREKGFMISVDDIGSGFSNLDRVIVIEPDIIKIDREIISGINNDYFKQQIVEMIVKMAEKTGALIVAEGVENISDILTVLRFGTHFLQGFYISKPKPLDLENICEINQIIENISILQQEDLSEYLTDKCKVNLKLRRTFCDLQDQLSDYGVVQIEAGLEKILGDFPQIECAYLIDRDGVQITGTIFGPSHTMKKENSKTLFTPCESGDNATLKEYYYVLKTTNQDMYISDAYISLATGSKCITISGYFEKEEREHILCIDMKMKVW